MYARTEAGPWVLYDLKDDPYEMRNLDADPAHLDSCTEMEAKLAAWMERTGDSWANDSMAPVEDKGRLYRFEAFYTIKDYLDWAKRHPDLAPDD
jgi:hypothetical protein